MNYKDMVREIFKDELEQKAAEAKKKTLLKDARNMMVAFNVTAQQAMDALKVSPELRKELLPLI